MSHQQNVTVPDHVWKVIAFISEEKNLSLSGAIVYCAEKGASVVLEEINKLEIAKKLVDARRERETKLSSPICLKPDGTTKTLCSKSQGRKNL